jgi:hypothetical protein
LQSWYTLIEHKRPRLPSNHKPAKSDDLCGGDTTTLTTQTPRARFKSPRCLGKKRRNTIPYIMSTTRLTIYDLLRITYTYESQALEAEARSRSNSMCSVSSLQSRSFLCMTGADFCKTPETCSMLSTSPPAPPSVAEALETDFTQRYCQTRRQ